MTTLYPIEWTPPMYPTPTTQDSRIGPNNIKGSQHRRERGNPALADKVLFPTPTTQEIEHPDMVLSEKGRRMPKKGKTDHSLNLADTVRLMYPSPTATNVNTPQPDRVETTKSGSWIHLLVLQIHHRILKSRSVCHMRLVLFP